MGFSLFTAALLGLASLSQAAPTMSLTQELLMMEDMRQGVATYVATYPPEEVQSLMRNVTDTARPNACTDVYLVFTRGTFEPAVTKNLGIMVGMPFSSAVKIALAAKSFDSIGVDYNNGVAGYLSGGDAAGGTTMAKMITDKVSECPNVKIVASGYSQGAQVTHNALATLSPNVKSHIAAVVVFGDPNKGKPIPGISSDKIWTNCLSGDPICAGIPLPLGAHLQYGSDSESMKKCVDFVVSHVS